MTNPIQAIRGMNDCLPPLTYQWQHVEAKLRILLTSYGFHEIRMPILEKTELFKRTIGEATDIVEKEMYTFADRNNDHLTLRPEGTASCVRAGIEHGLFYNQIQKLWYLGPYFRYERPQKGRYRQFHQCGVEFFGLATPDCDAELIMLSARIIKTMGLNEHVELQINSLGSSESRAAYRFILVDYFNAHHDLLDEDSQRRLHTNPLRILDSKNPALAQLIQNAPKLTEHLDAESAQHFQQLQTYLQGAGIAFKVNPCLVRGLDYYTKTVFEWVTTELGAQGTVIAGGRYDDLIKQLGGKATPALGFAMGMERLILLLQQLNTLPNAPTPDFYIMTEGTEAYTKALTLADSLRDAYPSAIVLLNSGGASLKNQFKKADKSGARFAITLGQTEMAEESVTLKNLTQRQPQELIRWDHLLTHLSSSMQNA